MHLGTKHLLKALKGSIGHCKNCSRYCPTSAVRLYHQRKPQIFLFGRYFRNAPGSHGDIHPQRFFSYKDCVKLEQENWRSCSANYTDITKRIKQRLEALDKKHSSQLSNPVIRFEKYIYFEENGCIFRSKLGEVDEGHMEVLLRAEELPFHDSLIQRIRISPDHKYMAAGIKRANSEECACIVVKLNALSKVECIVPNVFSFEWATHEILFYTVQKNLQCHDVYLFDFSKNYCELVYTEQDARYFVDVYRTKDKSLLTINSNSKTTSEVWLIDCCHPFRSPSLVQKRTEGIIYHVEHRNHELYILTTYGEPYGYKLMKVPVDSHGLENWLPIYTVKEKTKLIDLEMFKDHCIAFLKFRGQLHLDIISLVSTSIRSVTLPAWACSLELEPLPEHTTSSACYFWLSSPVQPPICFEYSLVENNLIQHTEQEVPITVNCNTVRLEAKSKDETWVPITVFHKANSLELHRKPLLIHVYGAYGIDLNMSFKPENLMLIEDDWILAYCHVRGGGELGLEWHRDGCVMKKHNGIQDFKACIKLLHQMGYSQPMLTAVISLSAGGVLAGALYNNCPHLIRAMVLQAPFLDVLNTMLDPDLPLTIEEQEEWGNPLADAACKEYIKSYCPYQNIRTQCQRDDVALLPKRLDIPDLEYEGHNPSQVCSECYPAVFITVSENDQRVPLAGLLRYIKKLRKAAQDNAEANSTNEKGLHMPNIILDIQPGGSHCAPSWEECLNQVATQLAFLYSELGLAKRE
ncbi:prolyl endopeptidase-like isoform X2 [Tiliqua scincoides]|uniref:prolyl endopeptidase-like isoform X2 n=1 Tax=Tiliqua scincoides TaxID=71010 RepID=UPI003461E851